MAMAKEEWAGLAEGLDQQISEVEGETESLRIAAQGHDPREFIELEKIFNEHLQEIEEDLHDCQLVLDDKLKPNLTDEDGQEAQDQLTSFKKRHVKLENVKNETQVKNMRTFGSAEGGSKSEESRRLVTQVQIQKAEMDIEMDRQEQNQIMIEIEKRVERLKDSATETNRELKEQTAMMENTNKNMEALQDDGKKTHNKVLALIEELSSCKRVIIIAFLAMIIMVLVLILFLDGK
eukprot:TRINITY_DN5036_c0_g1_i1.p1 TRINITY_DN5036_c0_g1~~TRINITY_DN5036_c0_g1_i1.p1  ORF type:complete len:235 (+),score=74.48 TRINITY_DN5036_c0_g1_i1:248-952(+)